MKSDSVDFQSFFPILGLSTVAQNSKGLSFFWEQNVPVGSVMPTANRHGMARCRRTWAPHYPRDPTTVTILWQDPSLPGFLQIHGAVQTWLPDVALAAVRKVHHLIFTDSRASRGLKWLLLFIKLMACFLWVSATAGSLILLRRDC